MMMKSTQSIPLRTIGAEDDAGNVDDNDCIGLDGFDEAQIAKLAYKTNQARLYPFDGWVLSLYLNRNNLNPSDQETLATELFNMKHRCRVPLSKSDYGICTGYRLTNSKFCIVHEEVDV